MCTNTGVHCLSVVRCAELPDIAIQCGITAYWRDISILSPAMAYHTLCRGSMISIVSGLAFSRIV